MKYRVIWDMISNPKGLVNGGDSVLCFEDFNIHVGHLLQEREELTAWSVDGAWMFTHLLDDLDQILFIIVTEQGEFILNFKLNLTY